MSYTTSGESSPSSVSAPIAPIAPIDCINGPPADRSVGGWVGGSLLAEGF